MKKLAFKHINHPTSPTMTKIGASCVALATFIAGYGLTSQNQIVGFVGLGIGAVGTIISIFYPPTK